MTSNYTFTIIKPDAVSKEQIGPILAMINESNFHIEAMKLVRFSRKQAEVFYDVHAERPFYKDLVDFMISGPVVIAILEKENAVEDYRKLIGATDPANAEKGTIRKRFASSIQNNAVHGSDSNENAKQEMDFFFSITDRFNRKGNCK